MLIVLAAGVAGAHLRCAARPAFRERFDAGLAQPAAGGRLARGYNAARFASTLAMLTTAGVPILRACRPRPRRWATAPCAPTRSMRWCWCAKARRWPRRWRRRSAFPACSMFARLGEQTGQLPLMLQRAANQLGAEVQRRAMQLATMLEPLLIVGMGLVVMLIVLAVLLPIIQLNQWVK
jgi:general secretion pathway protein F